MIFKYRGIDAEGKKVRDKVEAISLGEAKSKLKSKESNPNKPRHEYAKSSIRNL